MSSVLNDAEQRMEKSLTQLHSELSKIRTGRANPSLLDGIKVSCYGTLTPLNQVSSVSVEDSRTLTITPWDKNLLADIEKAIITSDLGLNPGNQGGTIRIALPPLSEERRRDFVKLAKSQGENTKVSIRNTRRDIISSLKDLVKEKEITEDDDRKLQAEVQKITDKYIAKVDSTVATKEEDLLKI
ncbi:MAG: ribosome recycling factor [Pseudomonadota bacterium]|nr:ribosome recycling factor [Pseudomonadota bacterium]